MARTTMKSVKALELNWLGSHEKYFTNEMERGSPVVFFLSRAHTLLCWFTAENVTELSVATKRYEFFPFSEEQIIWVPEKISFKEGIQFVLLAATPRERAREIQILIEAAGLRFGGLALSENILDRDSVPSEIRESFKESFRQGNRVWLLPPPSSSQKVNRLLNQRAKEVALAGIAIFILTVTLLRRAEIRAAARLDSLNKRVQLEKNLVENNSSFVSPVDVFIASAQALPENVTLSEFRFDALDQRVTWRARARQYSDISNTMEKILKMGRIKSVRSDKSQLVESDGGTEVDFGLEARLQ